MIEYKIQNQGGNNEKNKISLVFLIIFVGRDIHHGFYPY